MIQDLNLIKLILVTMALTLILINILLVTLIINNNKYFKGFKFILSKLFKKDQLKLEP